MSNQDYIHYLILVDTVKKLCEHWEAIDNDIGHKRETPYINEFQNLLDAKSTDNIYEITAHIQVRMTELATRNYERYSSLKNSTIDKK